MSGVSSYRLRGDALEEVEGLALLEVERIDLVEGVPQALTHATERGVMELRLVGDHPDNGWRSGLYVAPAVLMPAPHAALDTVRPAGRSERGGQPALVWYTRDVHSSSLLESTRPLIERALEEDIGAGDRTSETIVPPDVQAQCTILAKADGVVCGLAIAAATFQLVDSRIALDPVVQDGEPVEPGQPLAAVRGPARGILTAERTALNFLGRLSGIATLTSRFVDAVANYRALILDTRKTTPGWRALEKYAVRCGGGRNHRMGLYDMLLIKDNHIACAGGLPEAVRRGRAAGRDLPLQVEVRTLDELEQALELKVERVLLDNMDIPTLRQAVALAGGRAFLEASGGVSLSQAPQVASVGVDAISVGALTHSASALDLSLEMSVS